MKAALITPVPMLRALAYGNIHLLLDDLLQTYPSYLNYYRERSKRGDWIILDNSAHEKGAGNDHEGLMHRATQVGASEIVCPDALFDAQETFERTSRALEYYASRGPQGERFRYMVVPQSSLTGKDPRTLWNVSLHTLCELHAQAFPDKKFTIGLSKDYEVWPGGLGGLIEEYIEPLYVSQRYDFDLHLLGWGRDATKLIDIRTAFPWVRSVDSAKPYVYAWHYTAFQYRHSARFFPEYPGRPEGYFDQVFDQTQTTLAFFNSFSFRRFAGDRWMRTAQSNEEGLRTAGIDAKADI